VTSITKKAGSLLAIGLSTASVLGGALPAVQSVFAEGNKTEVTTKQADVAQVVAKANIDDSKLRENTGNVFSQGYTLNLTVPDSVKAGSVATIKVENLPLLFGSGDVKSADVTVDGTVIGKATLKKAATFRSQQIDAKTSFDQKKAANIKAGFGEYEYEIVFNDKATNFKNKDIVFKSASESSVFTSVSKDTTVKAKITVNDKEVATKDITIKPSAYQDDKVKSSTLDLSTNTQMIKNNDGTIKYVLAVGVRPMDQDYGVGDKITVTLPRDSMMKFTKEDVTAGKEIRIIPAFTKNSFANENNVLLSDTNAVTAKVAELNDNKVVFEITGGTLKRVNYYVFSTDETGASFRLTGKAAGKLAADGKSFGPETVTSSITTKDGKTNPTEVNTSLIRVNGATLTAKGVQEIIEKPVEKPTAKKEYITRWITIVENKETKLKEDFTGDHIKDPEKFTGYVLKKTEQDGNKTTYIYEKTKSLTTRWANVDKPEENLKDPFSGDKTQEAGNISGWTFVRTDTDKDGNVVHLFKKAETPATPEAKKVKTEWLEEVTNKDKDGKETKELKAIQGKDPVVAETTKEAGTISGFKFVRTDKDKDGNVKHIFVREAKTADKKDAVKTGANASVAFAPLLGIAGGAGAIGAAVYVVKKRK
jgi:surface repeat SSSPR-51 protein